MSEYCIKHTKVISKTRKCPEGCGPLYVETFEYDDGTIVIEGCHKDFNCYRHFINNRVRHHDGRPFCNNPIDGCEDFECDNFNSCVCSRNLDGTVHEYKKDCYGEWDKSSDVEYDD